MDEQTVTVIYRVCITAPTKELAEQVVRERLGHDEDLGFDYTIDDWSEVE